MRRGAGNAYTGAPVPSIRDHFDDFLMHGYLDHHPDDTGFKIESLGADQRANLVLLVESYFVAGYEYLHLWRFVRRNKSAWVRVSESPVRGEPNKLEAVERHWRIVFESLASSTHIAQNLAPWALGRVARS